MWQKGYAIKTKNHIVVDMCISVPVFLRHSVVTFPLSASEMTYILSGGALNSTLTRSLTFPYLHLQKKSDSYELHKWFT